MLFRKCRQKGAGQLLVFYRDFCATQEKYGFLQGYQEDTSYRCFFRNFREILIGQEKIKKALAFLRPGCYNNRVPFGGLAQLVRAFGSHPRGHRFEPYILHQKACNLWKKVAGFFCTFLLLAPAGTWCQCGKTKKPQTVKGPVGNVQRGPRHFRPNGHVRCAAKQKAPEWLCPRELFIGPLSLPAFRPPRETKSRAARESPEGTE